MSCRGGPHLLTYRARISSALARRPPALNGALSRCSSTFHHARSARVAVGVEQTYPTTSFGLSWSSTRSRDELKPPPSPSTGTCQALASCRPLASSHRGRKQRDGPWRSRRLESRRLRHDRGGRPALAASSRGQTRGRS